MKAAMEMLGTDSGMLRLPLTQISDGHREELRSVLEELELLKT